MRVDSRLIGSAVVLAGCALLLRNLGVGPERITWWPALLLAIGLVLLLRSVRTGGAGLVPGIAFTVCGAFLLLIPLGVIPAAEVGRYWGVFPGAIGVAFLVHYLAGAGHHSLVPAVILLGVGAFGLSQTVSAETRRWWPLVLVVVGLIVLTRRRR